MPTFTQIGTAQVVGAGGAATIDFTSIPATYTDLVIKISARTAQGYFWDGSFLRFNNTSTTYKTRLVYGDGSAAGSFNSTTDILTYINGASATASAFANTEIYIPNYAGSTQKAVSIDTVIELNGNPVLMNFAAGLWNGTTAINRITLVPQGTIQQYSTAYLYGVSNA
jgi:hypothetical protein